MGDVNNQFFHGRVKEVNGIKANNIYFDAKSEKQRQAHRSKLLKEILFYRHHCYELHLLLCSYAKERFQIKGTFRFIDLSDEQLEQVHQFSLPLQKVLFVYRTNIKDEYALAYKIAYAINKVKKLGGLLMKWKKC